MIMICVNSHALLTNTQLQEMLKLRLTRDEPAGRREKLLHEEVCLQLQEFQIQIGKPLS